MNPWTALTWLVLSLLILLILNRWVTRELGRLGYLLSGDGNSTALITFATLLPGVFLHELSHWLMAMLLRLRTGRFRVWPKQEKGRLRLGYVEVENGGVARDSLVGLSPFLLGSASLLLIGFRIFQLDTFNGAWQASGPGGIWERLQASLHVADAWVWLYLVFAISNAMMPSESDRQPFASVMLFIGILVAIAVILGAIPTIPLEAAYTLARGFNTLTSAFAFAIVVDLVFGSLIFLAQVFLARLSRGDGR